MKKEEKDDKKIKKAKNKVKNEKVKEEKLDKKKIKKVKVKKEDLEKEEIIEERLTFTIVEVVIIFLIAIILGGVIGALAVMSRTDMHEKELADFYTFYEDVTKNYYKKVNKDKLIGAGIEGMLKYLGDPYSTYMNKDETTDFDTTINGNYKGIGVSISMIEEKPTVVSVFDNSPAKKVGIKDGDIIVKVNDQSCEGRSLNDIVKMVKAKKDVKIVMDRKGKEKTFKLQLGNVDIPSVASKVFEKNDKKIGVISISVFSANTYKEFNKQLKKLEKKKIEGLVIDVRDNPGGHLDQVTDVLSLFMDKKKVIYQIKSSKKTTKVYSKTNEKRNYNIAVIINKNSASASEVLSAALKESYGAKVVGVKSYGKGTVQKEYSLSNGSSVKYTIEQWLTPNGNSINKKGIEPTDVVELDIKKYAENPTVENDNQLQTAIEIVAKDKKETKKEDKKEDKKEEKKTDKK